MTINEPSTIGHGWFFSESAKTVLPDALKPYESSIAAWLDFKREKGQRYKTAGLKALLKRMTELGAGLPEAVAHSMANNYADLFAPNGAGASAPSGGSIDPHHARIIMPEEE